MQNFSLPTSFEERLFDGIVSLNEKYSENGKKIVEIYGSLQEGIIGSGRNAWELPKVDIKKLSSHLKKSHKLGLKFNFLLNAPCLGNIEYSYQGRSEILDFLKLLFEIDVDVITITIPFLAELIKEHFPKFEINTSVYSNIDSQERALYYEKLGVDRITLDPNIYRNFYLLKKIRKNIKAKLQLMVNTSCLFRCPVKYYHADVTGHFSQKLLKEQLTFFPAFSFNEGCMLIRLKNPEEFIKTPWIRPEDIKYYADLGIDYFKIAGREYPTKYILKLADAYLSSSYKGNLKDILMGFFESYEFKKPLEFFINNEKLSGFLDFFINASHFPCSNPCDECNYCKKIAKEVVKIEENIHQDYIELFQKKLKERLRINYEGSANLSQKIDKLRTSRNLFFRGLNKLYFFGNKFRK